MGPFAQLLDALAETTHVLTVAVRCGDRTLAERTLRDARAIHGECSKMPPNFATNSSSPIFDGRSAGAS